MEQILEPALIFGPLRLRFQERFCAEGPRRAKELLALFGNVRVFDPKGRIQVAEIELAYPGEGSDWVMHGRCLLLAQALVGALASRIQFWRHVRRCASNSLSLERSSALAFNADPALLEPD